ncbi:hypothetical protein E4U16_006668 [Claviceps sp. LM84 group G4]|nr:hypothetical protein E4U16_006668 [Claviceps sp. LM84 group G4]
MKHAILMMLMEDKLFLSPIGENPQRLLDVGTGTEVFDPGAGLSYKSCNQLATPLCDDGTMLDDVTTTRSSTCTKGSKVPIGPWAKDRTMRVVGQYQKMAVVELLPAYAGRPLQALKMSEAEAEVAIAMARKSLDDLDFSSLDVHRYFNYYFLVRTETGISESRERCLISATMAMVAVENTAPRSTLVKSRLKFTK